jgi:putative hydrolase of the HAD superfamily
VKQDLSSIGAVIFDFGGVLCEHPNEARFAEIAHYLRVDPAEFTRVFWQHRIPYDAGLDEAEYWSTIVDELGLPWDPRQLPRLLKYEIDLWSQFDKRVFEFSEFLQGRGYTTGILSNLPRPLGEALLAKPGFMDPFDHHTFSYKLGIVKPAAAIYKHAIDGLGVAPEQALFLDDRPENVEGAQAAGLQAELYTQWEYFTDVIAPRYGLPLP